MSESRGKTPGTFHEWKDEASNGSRLLTLNLIPFISDLDKKSFSEMVKWIEESLKEEEMEKQAKATLSRSSPWA